MVPALMRPGRSKRKKNNMKKIKDKSTLQELVTKELDESIADLFKWLHKR